MGTRIVLILFLTAQFSFVNLAASQKKLVGKKTKVSFDKSLPEDISNKNFPDIIESFDYPNADILDLVKAIGKLTGLNFIIDPSVKGKTITVIAPSQITVAEAYKAFLSALAVNGLTLIKSGAFWKVQATEKAQKDNVEVYSGDYFPNTDQLITRIIQLNHVNAKEFSDSIKYLLSSDFKMTHYPSSNSVIISDYGSVIERVMKIVKALDVPGSQETVKVIPIQYASAESLAEMLNDLLSSDRPASFSRGSTRGSRRSNILSLKKNDIKGNVKISQIIADTRTNSIVVSANKAGFKRVDELIGKLDTYVDPSRTGGIYVYNVLYGTAEDVYNTLMGIQPSSKSSSRISSSVRSASFNRNSRRNRSSNNSKSTNSPLFGENVTIMADINTNSLIISAKNKYDFERVKQVLSKIDVPRDQVFVQAVIVEMSVNKGDNWEVNLAQSLGAGVKRYLSFLNIGADTPLIGGFLNRGFSADPGSILQNSRLGPGLILGTPIQDILKNNGLIPGDLGNLNREIQDLANSDAYQNATETEKQRLLGALRSSTTGSQSINQALSLSFLPLVQILKQAGDVNILSTPQITALDNTTAFIEVGENAPVGIKSTSAGFSAYAQNSVDRQDVTLKLEITPRINPDSGTVQMQIKQKFDDFSSRISTASELQEKGVHIIKRNIDTQMVLNDGETAVLGGLLTDKEVRNENKVPILGDIPVLGWLFKGADISKEKRNLVVFITPKIIKGEQQKEQMKKLLGQKIEERVDFVKSNLKGKDPHGKFMKKLKKNSSLQEGVAYSTDDDSWEDGDLDIIPEDVTPAIPSNAGSPEKAAGPTLESKQDSLDDIEEPQQNIESDSEEFDSDEEVDNFFQDEDSEPSETDGTTENLEFEEIDLQNINEEANE